MHEQSITLLNRAVADELSAVHQYMYFHFHCDDQGYDLLAGLFKQTAIEEMLHIERLAERVLFLKGDVEMVAVAEVQKIHDVGKMLECARQMEEDSAKLYNQLANECGANADSGFQETVRRPGDGRRASLRPVRPGTGQHGQVRRPLPGSAIDRAEQDPRGESASGVGPFGRKFDTELSMLR